MTLRDVARRSGVSTGTVSRVLNDKIGLPILPATVERIKLAARELEYSPNAVARALATGKTHIIGLFSGEMTDPHFAQMLETAEAAGSARGYHLIVSGTLESVSTIRRVDGVLILGSSDDPRFAGLPDRLPKVFVYHSSAVRPNEVAWSDEVGIGSAVKHLRDLGHRRIAALFCYGGRREQMFPKVRGFRDAVAGQDIVPWECWDTWSASESNQIAHCENGYEATRQMIRDGVKFTAIIARNDFLALGALRALRDAGISVPKDVSVTGYTDSIHAVCADPALTSVRTPIAEAGTIAVQRLICSIENREATFEGTMLPTTLEIRQSCAPCSRRP